MKLRRTTVLQVLILFAFWFALSGRTDSLFLVTGVLTAILVTAVTHQITGVCLRPDADHVPLVSVPFALFRAAGFVVWMAGRILAASVQLAIIALSPKMPLDPCTIRFRTELRSPIARATLANAISLVPGTLTVDIDGDDLLVHALSPDQVEDLVTGRLQNKVAAIFLEGPQPAVQRSEIQAGDVDEATHAGDGHHEQEAPE